MGLENFWRFLKISDLPYLAGELIWSYKSFFLSRGHSNMKKKTEHWIDNDMERSQSGGESISGGETVHNFSITLELNRE